MPYVRPVKLIDPWIRLGGDVGPPVIPEVDLKCFAKGVHLMGEEDDALMTFCDPLGYSWILTVDLLQSLGADGLEEALWSLGGPGTVVSFEFAYTEDVASVDNPHWSGKVRLSAWPIVDAQVNEPTEITLEMDVIGDITREPEYVAPVGAMEAATVPETEAA